MNSFDNEKLELFIKKTVDLIKLGLFEDAIMISDEALKMDPKNIYLLHNKGCALKGLGRFQKALEIFTEILKIDPKNAHALHGRGDILEKLGYYEDAIVAYNEVLKIQPKYVEYIGVLFTKGHALSVLSKYKEAIEIYNKVLEIDPKYALALLGKGRALNKLGRYEETIEICDRALENEPKVVSKIYNLALYGKGEALQGLCRYEEAIEIYDVALKFNPTDVIALSGKDFALRKLDVNLDKTLEKFPNHYVSNHYGLVSFNKKKYDEAIANFDKVLENDPQNQFALTFKSIALNIISEYREKKVTTQPESSGTYLFFDTETTGLPRNWNAPVSDLDNWPRLVQIAWVFYKNGIKISSSDFIIKPEGFRIPIDASNIHGITTERAEKDGTPLQVVLREFQNIMEQSDCLVAHNISFDEKIMGAEFLRKDMPNGLISKKTICTKERSTNFCAIPSPNGYSDYKWPKLSELYLKLFGTEFEDSHSALADVNATAECFWELKKLGIIKIV